MNRRPLVTEVNMRLRFTVAQLLLMISLIAIAFAGATSAFRARHYGHVYGVLSSPDRKLLAACDEDHSIKLWSLPERASQITLRGHRNLVRSLAFSPDSKLIASGSLDTTVRLWRTESGQQAAVLRGHSCANDLSFSPDGNLLAVADWQFGVSIWDVRTLKKVTTLRGNTGTFYAVAFSRDGMTLFTAGDDLKLRFWDVGSWKLRGSLSAGNVTSLAVSPDDQLLAAGTEASGIQLWEVPSRTKLRSLAAAGQRVTSVQFSPNGTLLAAGGAASDIHTIFPGNLKWDSGVEYPVYVGIRVWDVSTGQVELELPNAKTVWSVEFLDDGNTLVGATEHWEAMQWHLPDGEAQASLFTQPRHPSWQLIVALGILWMFAWSLHRRRQRKLALLGSEANVGSTD